MEPELRADVADLRDVMTRILSRDRGGPLPLSPADDLVRSMTRKEIDGISIIRMANGIVTKNQEKCGRERELSDAVEAITGIKRNFPESFLLPTTMPFQVNCAPVSRHFKNQLSKRATYQVGTPSTGGNLVETALLADSFIEVLRNETVTGQLGALYLTSLIGEANIPRRNSQTQTYWVGESTAPTESETTFDQVQLRPHTVGAISKISRLMRQQSTPAIEQLVRDDLLAVDALAVDAAALAGTGSSSQPTGIVNTAGVGAVVGGTNGANWTFDMLTALYTSTLVANVPQRNLGFAINGKTRGYLATLKSSTGQYLWNPTQSIASASPDQILGYPYATSNQLPANLTKGSSTGNCSMAIFGNWQELVIGEWGVIEVMVNPYDSTGFQNGDVLIRSFHTVDVGLRHAPSFAVCSDGLTPGF